MKITQLSEVQQAMTKVNRELVPEEEWELLSEFVEQYFKFRRAGLSDEAILEHEVHGENMRGLMELLNELLASGEEPEPPKPPVKKKPASKQGPSSPTPKKKTARAKKPGTSPAKKAAPKSAAKKQPPSGPVREKEFLRSFTVELSLIRRMANMLGKERTGKQVLALVKSVQKAIVKGLVRKHSNPSPYHSEIEWMQKNLVSFFNKHFKGKSPEHTETIGLTGKVADKIREIKDTLKVYPSVRLSHRYLGLMENPGKKAEAEKLLRAINRAEEKGEIRPDHPGVKLLTKAKKQLENFTAEKTNSPLLQQAELAGIARNCSCSLNGIYAPSAISPQSSTVPPPRGTAPVMRRSTDPRKGGEERLAFTGRWKKLFNQPGRGFTALLWGKAKSGKSTMALDFAHFLASSFGPTLYASLEEDPEGPTYADREKRLGAIHPNLYSSNFLPANLSSFDFVFVDSISWGKMGADMVKELIEKWAKKSFIFITHATNDGLPRGGMVFKHLVDILVPVESGKAQADGRYGPGSTNVRFN